MTDLCLGAYLTLKVGEGSPLDLDLLFRYGPGAKRITLGPGKDTKPITIGDVLNGLATMVDIDALRTIGTLETEKPWSAIFDAQVIPTLTVEMVASTSTPSVELDVELHPALKLPPGDLPSWLTIEPSFTVCGLVVSYIEGRGLDVRARVLFDTQQGAQGVKPALVSAPFALPPPKAPNLQVKYLGLGQRFGPPPPGTQGDPLKTVFDALEAQFTSNDPAELVKLKDYYHPDRDWFIGLHVEVRGWGVRALFNDPTLYGVEITGPDDTTNPWHGLLFEILYQKLGNGLGVYYGALTLPESLRRIQLGAVSVTVPSFQIWIYTNGDFKVAVGWPPGDAPLGVEVGIFTGGGGFYFAKLRSGDVPDSGGKALAAQGSAAVDGTPQYNPILEFGLAVWLGFGRSFSSGPFSASLSLTLRGTFQGVLAWCAPDDDPSKSSTVAKEPDYHWIAATVGILGELQGEIDLEIVQLSVSVELSITVGLAFETGYGTVANVTAHVEASASLKIVFIRITVHFSTTISQDFELSPGTPASFDGPLNPAFHGMNDWSARGAAALETALFERAAAPAGRPAPMLGGAPAADGPIALSFLLHPAADYDTTAPLRGVASLVIDAPVPGAAAAGTTTALEDLAAAFAPWLLANWSQDGTWSGVVTKLGTGGGAPAGWDLSPFLKTVSFAIAPIDLTQPPPKDTATSVAAFPMFDDLVLAWPGGSRSFATTAQTYDNYPDVVAAYFRALSLVAPPVGPSDATVAAASGATPPTGPSLVRRLFDDYFVGLARQLARELAATSPAGVLTPDIVARVGGLASRTLLNGLRLPDPSTSPSSGPIDPATLDPESAYGLAGQQFAVDATKTPVQASLSLRTDGVAPSATITFADGKTSATSVMPVSAPPPAPVPAWTSGAPDPANRLSIGVSAMAPARPSPVQDAIRTRLPWKRPDGSGTFVVPLPPTVLASAGGDVGLTATTSQTPPQPVPVQPMLLVPVRVHRVRAAPGADVTTGGGTATPQDPFLPFVYALDGTDDETRDRIGAALEATAAFTGATLSVLYTADPAGYASDALDPTAHPVVLAQTNLSTTSQPSAATAMLRSLAAPAAQTPPPSAGLDDVEAFLRLVWEASVVRSGGFALRYATAAGQPLPASLFDAAGATSSGQPSGAAATLTLAVTFPAGGPLQRWHNALEATVPAGYTGTLLVERSVGKAPLTVLAPSCPPGCVGLVAEWPGSALLEDGPEDLTDPRWVEQLYHLLELRVAGAATGSSPAFGTSVWSAPLTPLKTGSGADAATALAAAQDGEHTYRQVVPAYRYAAGAGDSPSPYAGAGGRPQLELRVGDVFGNVLDSGTYALALPILYTDPLLSPAAWPGTSVAYGLGPDPHLRIELSFDPSVVLHATDPEVRAGQAVTALQRYATAAAQLADPNVAVSLTATVVPEPGTVGDAAALRQVLADFAGNVVAQLQSAATPGGAATPVATSYAAPIDPADLARLPDDVFALVVELSLTRADALVYRDGDGRCVPGADRVCLCVAPDFAPPAGGTERAQLRAQAGDPPVTDVSVETFAANVRQLYGGQARIALRTGQADLSAAAGPAYPWVVRWGGTAGISVVPAAGTAAYFSFAPLSVVPLSDTASVPTYDGQLAPDYGAPLTFTDVDLDAWAAAFLGAMDRLLAPDVATTIAAAAPAGYDDVMLAKATLAQCVAAGVKPVLEGTSSTVVDGDPAAAQELYEQAALARLSSAFEIGALVQVPVSVTAHGGHEGPAPRLFGGMTGVPAGSGVTLTTAKLSLDGASPYLGFFVSAGDPEAEASVTLSPAWSVRFVEDVTGAGFDGYLPSEWLRLVAAPADPALDLALGELDVPLPSRTLPPAPLPKVQTAAQSGGSRPLQSLADALSWDYAATVELPSCEAQDGLWVAVTYNEAATAAPVTAALATVDPDPTLFQALAGWSAAWGQLGDRLLALPGSADAPVGEPGTALIGAVVDQVKRVTSAWARHCGVPDPWAPPPLLERMLAEPVETPPAPVTDTYLVDLSGAFEKPPTVEVYGQAGADHDVAPAWPTVQGAGYQGTVTRVPSGRPMAGWFVATYPFAAGVPAGGTVELALTWPGIAVLDRQTARPAFTRVRNLDLGGGGGGALPTSSAFVYQTAATSFAGPAVPFMVVPSVGPLDPDPASLATTLETALAPLAAAGAAAANARLLKVGIDYRYPLDSAAGLSASTSILLADQVSLVPDGAAAGGPEGETLATLCTALDRDCSVWFAYMEPRSDGATLALSLYLFADIDGSRLPLIRVDDLEIRVPAGWWPPA